MKFDMMYKKIEKIFESDVVTFLSPWEDSIEYFVDIFPTNGILLAEDLEEFQKEFDLLYISIVKKDDVNNLRLTFQLK